MISLKKKNNEIIVPIVITIILIAIYALYFILIYFALGWNFLSILLGVVTLFITYIMIKVCRERIKEIKEGEEDDLSKY